jgi:hypothetical protein
MSWTRKHLETMTEVQLTIRQLIEEAGTDAVGADNLIETNELVAEAHSYALLAVERAEHQYESRAFAEALRPFALEAREGQ